jgi:hypothetical protein
MNVLQAGSATVALVAAIAGSLWVGMSELRAIEHRADAKFVPLSDWQDFQWSQLKRDIRQIEKEIAQAEADGLDGFADRLRDEYDNLVEFLCRKYPEDREC